ncbi:MAG TPA: protoporphyrinogen oxidase, partial [Actinomycetales bacterium]|nr:protoporphyrinogen oxidase [Actinomycetales bacterium]
VAVVGAGVAGLSAAWRLVRDAPSTRVVVLESAGRVGGKLALEELGGLVVDVGAESLLARRPEAVDLVRDVGLGHDLTTPRPVGARLLSHGQLRALPAGTLMGVPSSARSLDGLLTPREAALVDEEPAQPHEPVVADVDVASFVSRRLGQAVVDRIVEPLLGGVYAGHAGGLSLRATVPPLWEAAVAGRSVVETAARAAQVGAATQAPVFAGVRGGVGRLPLAVADALTAHGVEVRTRATVRRLGRRPGGWRVVVGPTTEEQPIDVDAVVLAIPAAPTSRLLADVAPGAAAALARIEYASIGIVTLVLPRAGLPPAVTGSGFLVPPVEGRYVKAATFSSAKWAWLDEAAPHLVVMRASVGRHREERDLQADDVEIVARAVADLGDALGAPLPAPVASSLTRWGGGLPQYAVGHVDVVDLVRREVARLPGLAVAGAVYEGVGVPACVASGARAATAVLTHLAAREEERRQSTS